MREECREVKDAGGDGERIYTKRDREKTIWVNQVIGKNRKKNRPKNRQRTH